MVFLLVFSLKIDWNHSFCRVESILIPAPAEQLWFRFWFRCGFDGVESIPIPLQPKTESIPESESIPVESSTSLLVTHPTVELLQ